MKVRLTTIANLATIGACLMIGVTAAPMLQSRWFGSGQPTAGPPPVEYVNDQLTTSIPKPTATGNPTATVAVIEFSDFQCPFCGRYARETFPGIQKEYIDTGKLVYGFRHFPLSIHPLARARSSARFEDHRGLTSSRTSLARRSSECPISRSNCNCWGTV